MNKQEYEKIPIIESAYIRSKEMPDMITIHRRDYDEEFFCWKNVYYRIPRMCPKTMKSLKKLVMFDDEIIDGEELLQFLSTDAVTYMTQRTVFNDIKIVRNIFRDTRKYELEEQEQL